VSADLARARDLLEAARRIVVLTGAGISAESGVPTFRGVSGLWKSFRPEELATPEAFARDPRLVWEWYAWRRTLVTGCNPNDGHRALARLALDKKGTTLVTQNVDGLHHRAARDEAGGRDPTNAYPLEVHGAIHRDRCASCGTVSDGRLDIDSTSVDALPRCAGCDGMLRPDVVWFGETLDPAVIGAAFDAAGESDVCLVVGTSAIVHPAASVPLATLRNGGQLIEVNPEETPLTADAAVSIRGAAGEILPSVVGH
jgi:NAD-dependent deacetylase